MVQLMRVGNRSRCPLITHSLDKHPVKIESEDSSLEEDQSPFTKRSKISPTDQKWCIGSREFLSLPPSKCNPLEEPSPLGLRLRKSPSLLDLIHLRLSQATSVPCNDSFISSNVTNDAKGGGVIHAEKLKASNFSASLLRIGHWEYISKYEGDLVAKCYFAKHKLVWEVLEGGLKSKLEIQWSDIMGLKATCPETGPGTLNVMLARQPLFFRETNPQPRKHTLWQATADFTNGQASIHREHFLQCPQGLLNRHFEKLTQCDMRLHFLSQQQYVIDSRFFDPQDESSIRYYRGNPSNMRLGFRNEPTPRPPQPSSYEPWKVQSALPKDTNSGDSSISDTSINVEREGGKRREENETGSVSVSDIVSHIEKQMASGTSFEMVENWNILQDIACHLLSDSQITTISDEKSLMSRVSSLCCLLQKDAPAPPVLGDKPEEIDDDKNNDIKPTSVSEMADFKASFGDLPRKDSFGEVLLQLPRITSLPKFLFNVSEDPGS